MMMYDASMHELLYIYLRVKRKRIKMENTKLNEKEIIKPKNPNILVPVGVTNQY